VSEVARRVDVVPGQIYRWRRDLGSTAAGITEVVVSPSSRERSVVDAPAVEIDFGTVIRARIPMTTPKELACAVIKALAAR
jgi:transposase